MANEIYSLYLAMDGSAKPPGDRIDVKAFVYPEAKDANLEVLAYLVYGDQNQEQVPVMATGESKHKDREGRFKLVTALMKEGRKVGPEQPGNMEGGKQLKLFDESLVVPYSDLKVPRGEHRLGYEVRLIVDGQLADARPTPLGTLLVSDKVRSEMVYPVVSMVHEHRVGEIEGLAWSDNKLVPTKWMHEDTVAKPVFENKTASVHIDGEYRRGEIANGEPTDNGRPSQEFVPDPRRTIYFATNREIVRPGGTADNYFGNESVLAVDKMSYGTCVVSIPVHHHRPGDIEQPGRKWWFWVEDPNPDKHFLVQEFDPLLGLEGLKQATSKDDVLVYVHGYDNTFRDAILRSAQLQHDLEFPGKTMAFCWPSAGSMLFSISDHFDATNPKVELAYKHDEQVAARSHAFLAALLGELLQQKAGNGSKGKVHVIAHSMGNRVLLKALHELNSKQTLGNHGTKLGQVFLAAADINGSDFSNVRSALLDSCDYVNYYFARDDGALAVSRLLHQDKPIGLGPVFDKDHMDTICADNLTCVFHHVGHSYLGESRSMLTDIRLIVTRGLSPLDRRPPLGPRIEAPDLSGYFLWTFLPER